MNDNLPFSRSIRENLTVRIYMRQAVGDRDLQEDAMKVSSSALSAQKGILAVLADGMGGMSCGELFSSIAVDEMMNCFAATPYSGDLCSMLETCYQAAQAKAIAAQNPAEGLEGGATVTAVLIRNRTCAFLSAGDSRICLLRGGQLIQLNREHVLGHVLDERAAFGYITQEEADLNIERKAITCHLGRKGRVPHDICASPIALVPGDKLLLMSDGVFGTLDDQEIARLVSLPHCNGAEAVISAVLAKKKPRQDNCSILLISIDKYRL